MGTWALAALSRAVKYKRAMFSFRAQPVRGPHMNLDRIAHGRRDVVTTDRGVPTTDRSGVALILVVGLLALMVVMGVTFSIYMRTERVAAGNFLNDVRTRNLLHVALNRALVEIEASTSTNIYPPWDMRESVSTGERVSVPVTMSSFSHLPTGAISSQGQSTDRRQFLVTSNISPTIAAVGTVLNLTSLSFGTITQVVPNAVGGCDIHHTTLQGGASTFWEKGDQFALIQPCWIDLPAGTDEGRVGYVAINASGLLDANYTWGLPRGSGLNANEIRIDALPEIVATKEGDFVDERTVPYETLQELTLLGTNNGSLRMRPMHFVTYSAFPVGDGAGVDPVDIGGDENALLARYSAITNALVLSGIDASQAAFVFTNLLDYVDTNCVPHDLASPCTESVPMINEVIVTNSYRFKADTNFTLSSRFYVECFYPFVKPNANSFWLSYTASVESVSAPAGFPIPPATNGVVDTGYPANTGVFRFDVPFFSLATVSNNYAAFVGQKVTLRAKLSLQIRAGVATGDPVDAAPVSGTIDIALPEVTVPPAPASGQTIIGVSSGSECYDPRFNWDGAPATRQWRTTVGSQGSLFGMNAWATNMLESRDTDGHAYMFVSDSNLVSVSELTYLLRGRNPKPNDSPLHYWNTIRLFDRQGPILSMPLDTVLDHFVVGTTGVVKGAVNINTGKRDVMSALFKDAPLNSYPNEKGAGLVTVTAPEADAMASVWVDPALNPLAGNFLRLSDIGHMTNIVAMAPYAAGTPFQQESFFRNNCGLMGVRQNLYTVLLYAQTTKVVPLLPQKSVVSGVVGIAEVWRDPIAPTNGVRNQFVRYFSILSD